MCRRISCGPVHPKSQILANRAPRHDRHLPGGESDRETCVTKLGIRAAGESLEQSSSRLRGKRPCYLRRLRTYTWSFLTSSRLNSDPNGSRSANRTQVGVSRNAERFFEAGSHRSGSSTLSTQTVRRGLLIGLGLRRTERSGPRPWLGAPRSRR